LFAGTAACRHGSFLDRWVPKATEINERACGLSINKPRLFYIHEKEEFICSRTALTVSEMNERGLRISELKLFGKPLSLRRTKRQEMI
jgi:hypothetical protein